jgi:hypothetical protein
MRVVAGDDGIVKRARIWWRAPCARPTFVFRESRVRDRCAVRRVRWRAVRRR